MSKIIEWLLIISISLFCVFSFIYFINTVKDETILILKIIAVILGMTYFIDGFGVAFFKKSFLNEEVIFKIFISLVFFIGGYLI